MSGRRRRRTPEAQVEIDEKDEKEEKEEKQEENDSQVPSNDLPDATRTVSTVRSHDRFNAHLSSPLTLSILSRQRNDST